MARPRLLTVLVLAGCAGAAAVILRRHGSGPGSRVELYFEDGTVTKLESGDPGSDRMLALAREALSAARPVL